MKLLGNNSTLTNIAIGAGIAFLAPAVIGIIGGILRPVAKTAIKGGMLAYDATVGAIQGTTEAIGDLAAEAKAEVSEEER
jgi:hypothetical protein